VTSQPAGNPARASGHRPRRPSALISSSAAHCSDSKPVLLWRNSRSASPAHPATTLHHVPPGPGLV